MGYTIRTPIVRADRGGATYRVKVVECRWGKEEAEYNASLEHVKYTLDRLSRGDATAWILHEANDRLDKARAALRKARLQVRFE